MLHHYGNLNHLNAAILPVFPWPIILIYLVHSPYLVYLSVLPRVHTSLSQDGFYCKDLWVEHPLTSLPFDLRGAFLHVGVIGNISSLQESEICGLSKVQPPLLFPVILILEFRCTGD